MEGGKYRIEPLAMAMTLSQGKREARGQSEGLHNDRHSLEKNKKAINKDIPSKNIP